MRLLGRVRVFILNDICWKNFGGFKIDCCIMFRLINSKTNTLVMLPPIDTETSCHLESICSTRNARLTHMRYRITNLCIWVRCTRPPIKFACRIPLPASSLIASMTAVSALELHALFRTEFRRADWAGHECRKSHCQQQTNVGSAWIRNSHACKCKSRENIAFDLTWCVNIIPKTIQSYSRQQPWRQIPCVNTVIVRETKM